MKYTHLLYILLLCSAFIHASDGRGSEQFTKIHKIEERIVRL
jgi:hypothetical protein